MDTLLYIILVGTVECFTRYLYTGWEVASLHVSSYLPRLSPSKGEQKCVGIKNNVEMDVQIHNAANLARLRLQTHVRGNNYQSVKRILLQSHASSTGRIYLSWIYNLSVLSQHECCRENANFIYWI